METRGTTQVYTPLFETRPVVVSLDFEPDRLAYGLGSQNVLCLMDEPQNVTIDCLSSPDASCRASTRMVVNYSGFIYNR
jgi:hypothetical protein